MSEIAKSSTVNRKISVGCGHGALGPSFLVEPLRNGVLYFKMFLMLVLELDDDFAGVAEELAPLG